MKSKKGKITIAIIAVCVVVALTSGIMSYSDCGTPISSVLYFVAMVFGSAKVCEFLELHDDWEEWERGQKRGGRMTTKEALYWCEQFTDNIVLADPQKEKMVLALQAMEKCKEALEKQMPKKPYMDNENGIYETEHCPTCHRRLFPNDHHCRCGQALDWSDEE